MFLLNVPHWWQSTSPAWNGSVRMVAPQAGCGRWSAGGAGPSGCRTCTPSCRSSSRRTRAGSGRGNRRSGKRELNTLCRPMSSRSFGQQVHLQEALVGLLLDLDQVRDRDRGLDLGKINSLAGGAVDGFALSTPYNSLRRPHSQSQETARQQLRTPVGAPGGRQLQRTAGTRHAGRIQQPGWRSDTRRWKPELRRRGTSPASAAQSRAEIRALQIHCRRSESRIRKSQSPIGLDSG